MATTGKALTGKRVYRMSSHAPNRGMVDPAGYIKRERRLQAKKPMPPTSNKDKHKFANGHDNRKIKVGTDGKSDTRSGLAAQALARVNGGNMYTSLAAGAGSAAPGPGYIRPPSIPTATKSGLATQAASTALKSGATKLGPRPVVPPTVKINNNGLLDLPFDMQSSMEALQRQQAANNSLLDLNVQSQNQALTYGQQMRAAAQAYQQQKRGTLNNNSARGTAFSSGYGVGVGRDATNYNNQTNDLTAGNSAFQNQVASQRNLIAEQLNDFLRQQALSRYDQLSASLGTLGLGR